MSKKNKIEITEIFMAKPGNDWSRCFHGTIRRDVDENGDPIVYGKIKLNDGYIYAMASDQWELGDKLDELVLMVLDYGLHSDAGATQIISGTACFLN